MQLLLIKKLKKDGSIDKDFANVIFKNLDAGKIIVFPIDGIYGLLSVYSDDNISDSEKNIKENGLKIAPVIILNFNLIEQSALINKKDYDFLRRIWPYEINVKLNGNINNNFPDVVTARIPRYQFIQDILNDLAKPLVFYPFIINDKKTIFKKKEIIEKFESKCELIVYLNEWSRAHIRPTLIDITSDKLVILEKGKTSVEEIQSLFFLDTSG